MLLQAKGPDRFAVTWWTDAQVGEETTCEVPLGEHEAAKYPWCGLGVWAPPLEQGEKMRAYAQARAAERGQPTRIVAFSPTDPPGWGLVYKVVWRSDAP